MNLRIVLCAGGVMLCATTALILSDPQPAAGQAGRETPADGPRRDVAEGADSNNGAGSVPRASVRGEAPRPFPGEADGSMRRVHDDPMVHPVQAQQESAITRELRALYEKNGRQMPEMNLRRLPATVNQAREQTGQRNLQRKTDSGSGSRFDFLKNILPFGRAKSKPQPPRRPTYYNASRRRTIPTPPRFPSQHGGYPAAPSRAPGRIHINAAPINPVPVPVSTKSAQPAEDPGFFPADKPAAQPKPADVPLLIDDPATQQPAAKTAETPAAVGPQPAPSAGTTQRADPLNPFPGQPESPADSSSQTPADPQPVAGKPAPEQPATDKADADSPFTGKTLNDDGDKFDPFAEPAKTPAVQTPANETPNLDEHPLQIKPEPKRMQSLKIKSAQQLRREQLGRPAAESKPGRKKLSREAKLWLIAERKGLPGFRGFCPVELRDNRDLVDSRPLFRSVYQGKTYFLSSAEAKEKFDASPESYAPAMGGRDVIRLINGTESVEGSLAHALWFRGRLYMFSGAQTLRQFARNPQKYAVSP